MSNVTISVNVKEYDTNRDLGREQVQISREEYEDGCGDAKWHGMERSVNRGKDGKWTMWVERGY